MGLLILFLVAAAILLGIGTVFAIHRLRHPTRKTYATALARGLCVDPLEMGLEAEPVSFQLDDGHAAPGWIIAGRHRAGPTVIFTHGWSDSRYTAMHLWTPLLAPLCSHVVFYDMRAHGESEAPLFHGGAREAADLGAIITQVRDHTGSRCPLVLMGHSMGGAISIRAAAGAAGEAAAAAGRGSIEVDGVVVEGVYRYWHRPLRRIIWHWGWPPEPLATLIRMGVRLIEPGMGGVDVADVASQLRCPLLVMHARNDWMCPLADAAAVAEAAPRGELIALDSERHLGLVEDDGERYFEALVAFFAHLAPAPAQPARPLAGARAGAASTAPASPGSPGIPATPDNPGTPAPPGAATDGPGSPN